MHTILDDQNDQTREVKKYFIISDLHLEFWTGKEKEFWETFPKTQGCKACICAGDLTSFGLPDAVVFYHFKELCKRFDKVLYVPGNHEYYGSNPTDVHNRLANIEDILSPTLKVLRTGESYVYDGQRFIGDTMWFIDKPEVHIYKRMINDSFQIKGLFPWAFTQSNLFTVFLRENIKEDDIIITHHIPTDNDTDSRWKGSATQSYFLNDTSDRYFKNPNTVRPKAWIYGHTHDYHMYSIDRTRFICNPAGYSAERVDWRNRVIYEI